MDDYMNHQGCAQLPEIVVGVLVYNTMGEILLAQMDKWKNKWVIVGGHVEFGESLEECAKREVKEETYLDITDVKFVRVQEAIFSEEASKRRHFIFINYSALAISGEIKQNEEIVNYIWINPNDALKMDIISSTRDLVSALDFTGNRPILR